MNCRHLLYCCSLLKYLFSLHICWLSLGIGLCQGKQLIRRLNSVKRTDKYRVFKPLTTVGKSLSRKNLSHLLKTISNRHHNFIMVFSYLKLIVLSTLSIKKLKNNRYTKKIKNLKHLLLRKIQPSTLHKHKFH